jgi:Methyltransferase domain
VSESETRAWRQWVQHVPFLDRSLRRLRRSDLIEGLQHSLERLRGEDAEPFLTRFPPGHFYSPVPNIKDIKENEDEIFFRGPRHLEGIDLNEDAQLELLKTLTPMINDVTLPSEPRPGLRYCTKNPGYGWGDALTLQALLRHLRPSRYLEVGSGWSTALALDTNDRWLQGSMRVTCIEPYPDELSRLLRPEDDVEVIQAPVQRVGLDRFRELEPGDFLFVDCSHVVKTGSDSHYVVTRILPAVPAGVYVHIHDIFWPFEYPKDWVYEGRAWSEAYLLHAFLLFNQAFEIVLFNDWLMHVHHDLLKRDVPAMAPGAGAALWLRRRA